MFPCWAMPKCALTARPGSPPGAGLLNSSIVPGRLPTMVCITTPCIARDPQVPFFVGNGVLYPILACPVIRPSAATLSCPGVVICASLKWCTCQESDDAWHFARIGAARSERRSAASPATVLMAILARLCGEGKQFLRPLFAYPVTTIFNSMGEMFLLPVRRGAGLAV